VIAAVNGMAVGGGFEIALSADLMLVGEHAEMWLSETRDRRRRRRRRAAPAAGDSARAWPLS
jgi:hypothetical protein